MSAKGHLKPAVAQHLIEVHSRNGTLDKLLDKRIGDDLRPHLAADAFAFGAGTTAAAGSEPWIFDGTGLRMVGDITPGGDGSGVMAVTWLDGRAHFIGHDGAAENLYAFDPVAGTLSITHAGLSATARASQIALSAGDYLVVVTANPALTENRALLIDTQGGAARDLLDGTHFETSPYTPIIPAGDLGTASYFAVNGQVDGVWSYQLYRLDSLTGQVEQAVPTLAFEQAGGAAGDRLFFGAREGAGEAGALVLYSIDAQGNLRDYPMPDGYLTGLGGDFVALGEDVYFRTAARYQSDINRIDAAGTVTRIEDHAVMVGSTGDWLVLLDLDGPNAHYIRIGADGARTDFAPLPAGESLTQDHALAGGDLYFTTRDDDGGGQHLYRLDILTGRLDPLHDSARIDILTALGADLLVAWQAGSDPLPDGGIGFYTLDGDAQGFADAAPVAAPDDLRFGWDPVASPPDAFLF